MENQFFRCTQRAITQRCVITLGPIFIKMVLNRAQGLKKKSQEVSARKNNNRQRYNKKCRGGADSAPPALLGLMSHSLMHGLTSIFTMTFILCLILKCFSHFSLSSRNRTGNYSRRGRCVCLKRRQSCPLLHRDR